MAFSYDPSSDSALLQGELLSGVEVVENYRRENDGIDVDLKSHPWALVLSPACDLDWDYKARGDEETAPQHRRLRMVTLVAGYELEDMVKATGMKTRDVRESAKLLRFHTLEEVEPEPPGSPIPRLFIDFAYEFTVPTDVLYRDIESGRVSRQGVLPVAHTFHLIQRYWSFRSRVGLPDD